jgi:hypothetical protein
MLLLNSDANNKQTYYAALLQNTFLETKYLRSQVRLVLLNKFFSLREGLAQGALSQ